MLPKWLRKLLEPPEEAPQPKEKQTLPTGIYSGIPHRDSTPQQPVQETFSTPARELVYFGGAASHLMTPPPPPPEEVYLVIYLQGVECGPPQVHEGLTLFPLFRREAPPRDYLLLQEAMAQKSVVIREINEQGSVPKLEIENRGTKPVLILDSELFLGGKQDRLANATYLLAPKKSHHIDVSCVEQGRWAYDPEAKKQDLRVGFGMFAATGRGRKLQSVSRSFRSEQTFTSDQMAVWHEVGRYLHQTQAHSATQSYLAAQAAAQSTTQSYLDAIPCQEHQVGQIAYLQGHFLALDMLEHPALAEQMYTHWLASYIHELHDKDRKPSPNPPKGESLLESLWQLSAEARPSLSMGQDLRFQGKGLLGAGLALEQRLIHLSIFPNKSKE
ncbi:MAG: hypothetical protein H6728_09590 [Myxococcales bacterium]|nr:hypothetical protein [Myxococcales bacterium]MCB9643315.1 hypothetical protein [Myxococcales bacterium]